MTEFFTDALLNPYADGSSPAEVNWTASAFTGNVMTIVRNGQNQYGGPQYAGWVRWAGSIPEFPKRVEAVFTTDVWSYISSVDITLFRELGNYNTCLIPTTTIVGNQNSEVGLPFPDAPDGGGPYTYHFAPEWFDAQGNEVDYEELMSTAGILVVEIEPRSNVSPTIQFTLQAYTEPDPEGMFWTGYVKTQETLRIAL